MNDMTCNECAWIKGYEKTSFFGHRHCDYECSCLCHVMSEENGKSKYSNKVKNLLTEAIRRRDAELLEKVENMLDNNNCSKHWSDGCRICASNESICEVIKLIKGE